MTSWEDLLIIKGKNGISDQWPEKRQSAWPSLWRLLSLGSLEELSSYVKVLWGRQVAVTAHKGAFGVVTFQCALRWGCSHPSPCTQVALEG